MAARGRSRGFHSPEHLQRRTADRVRQGARMSVADRGRYGEDRRTLFRQFRNRRGTAKVQGNDGAAEGNGGGIDTNFTNSHRLTHADWIEVVRFAPIRVIRVSNLTRLLPLPARRGPPPVLRDAAAADG